jgi:hypothetical protein
MGPAPRSVAPAKEPPAKTLPFVEIASALLFDGQNKLSMTDPEVEVGNA